MSLPAYQINILSPVDGSVNAVFDAAAFDELRFTRLLNDVGVVAITLPSTELARIAFELDAFIEIYREDVTGALALEETYLTRSVHRFIENEREMLVIGGVSLVQLLMRRIVDPIDDPLQQGGYSAKIGNAATVIYEYCNQQIGPIASIGRRVNSLTVLLPTITGSIAGARLRHENLFNEIKKLAVKGRIDFTIQRALGNNLELFIGQIGVDRTITTNEPLGLGWVGLNPLRGNLTAPSVLLDRKAEANVCYALGQGAGDRRIVAKVEFAASTDSIFNRSEFAEDIRNVARVDLTSLYTGAFAALREKQAHKEFTYSPTGIEPGNIYHEDWDVGDWVTVEWQENIQDFRIVGVDILINEQGELITPTVSDQYLLPGQADTDFPILGSLLPTRATCWRGSDTGGALTQVISTSQMYNGFHRAAGNGHSTTHSVFLRDGIYTFSVLGVKDNDNGKSEWFMDGVTFATDDWYNNAQAFNQSFSHDVTVIGDGYHVITCTTNGKNASSGSFNIEITKYWLKLKGGD